MSFSLPRTRSAWNTAAFAAAFKEEIAGVDPARLPLLRLLQHGSEIVGTPQFMPLGSAMDGNILHLRTGVFLHSILSGCSCADDPTPIDTRNEYGELELLIGQDGRIIEIRAL